MSAFINNNTGDLQEKATFLLDKVILSDLPYVDAITVGEISMVVGLTAGLITILTSFIRLIRGKCVGE